MENLNFVAIAERIDGRDQGSIRDALYGILRKNPRTTPTECLIRYLRERIPSVLREENRRQRRPLPKEVDPDIEGIDLLRLFDLHPRPGRLGPR